MIGSVDLSPAHCAIVQRILKEHVQECEVRAFGSRVAWTAKDSSDLDLAVVGKGPLPWQTLSRLKEVFEESPLPMRVDVLDWHAISESFRKVIERGYVVVQERAKQPAPNELREVTLGEVADVSWGDTSTTKAAYTDTGFPAYSASGQDGYLPYADFDQLGVVLSAIGANCGKTWLAKGRWSCIKNTIRFWSIDPTVDTEFLYWKTRDSQIWPKRGSAQPFISQGDARAVQLDFPPLPEQRAIAHVLGTLDDKIELNRRMNQTLEEMARALFKSWFVDFDPVRAKAALKQHALRQHATIDGEPSGNGDTPSAFGYHSPFAGEPGGGDDAPSDFRHHSPLEGESARRGALAPSSRWGKTQHGYSTWKEIQRSYSKKTLEQAKALRQRQTDAEGLLWHYLRKKQLGGYKFRRQQPIGPYIVDFACMPEKLLVELDGGQHAERADHDERRDAFLRSKGFRVLRFWNNEVFENCFGVLERVYEALPNPPPRQPEPAGSTAATPPQGGSDGTPSPDSTPSPLKAEGEGGGAPAPAAEWTVERARAYLAGMDPQIADLFPDRLVDSELGGIPEGWEVITLGELTRKPQYGYTQSAKDDPIGPKFLRITDINKKAWVEWESVPHCEIIEADFKKYRLYKGDILITRMADPGHGCMIEEEREAVFASYLIRFRPIQERYARFLQYWLRSDSYWELVRGRGAGTTRISLNAKVLSGFPLAVATDPILEQFSDKLSNLRSRGVANTTESHVLAAQRDALLPKLVAGNIRLRDAAKQAEAVA